MSALRSALLLERGVLHRLLDGTSRTAIPLTFDDVTIHVCICICIRLKSPATICMGGATPGMGSISGQYNGMIAPLQRMTIKGVVWYQGESNANQWELYTCRFKVMIEQWRRQWYAGTEGATDREFPVGFVQIGPIIGIYTGPGAGSSQTFATRMGQTAGYAEETLPSVRICSRGH